MRRFPTRTLVLMALAGLSVCWFFWRTHQNRPQEPLPLLKATLPEVEIVEGGDR